MEHDMTVKTMQRSWLVQRLNKPRGVTSPFAFGGGLKNGGLSDEAMNILNQLWSFDYMGAAEFEFGAVPKTLERIAKDHKKLVAFSFDLDVVNEVAEDKWKGDYGDIPVIATIYVMCHKDWREEVENRIRGWASERWGVDLKETTRLASTLRPSTEWDGETVGWLELDNGFMFFTDREMWEKTCDTFGVEHG